MEDAAALNDEDGGWDELDGGWDELDGGWDELDVAVCDAEVGSSSHGSLRPPLDVTATT